MLPWQFTEINLITYITFFNSYTTYTINFESLNTTYWCTIRIISITWLSKIMKFYYNYFFLSYHILSLIVKRKILYRAQVFMQ